MSDYYDFRERLEFTEGVDLSGGILQHIHDSVPAAKRIRKACINEDRHGTDYWIDRQHEMPSISIDLKNREFCPIEKFGKDDVCIETTSVYLGPDARPYLDCHRSKPGWTVDERKRTDLLVYTWPHAADLFGAPKLRFWILYFPFLCKASSLWWRDWAAKYGERSAWNKGYITLSTYVPRSVVAKAMKELTVGVV